MKKKILWLMLSWLIVAALVLASCGEVEVVGEQEEEEEEEEPVEEEEQEEEEPTPDAKQIEAVLKEYYDAFYCYDVDRVGKTIAKESLEEEGAEILLSVAWAESINFEGELKSITSIQIDGNTALAVVECETSLGLGEDTWHLVREDGSWKIASRAETSEPTIEEPEPTPATFTIHDLSISPGEIATGEEITITAHISNIGDEAGECILRLEMDNDPLRAFDISLDGGFSERIAISCKVDYPPGTYSVNIDGMVDTATFVVSSLSGTFTVRGTPSFEPIVITGSSDKTSPPFTITTEEWVIDWSYVPDPEYPNFAVFGFFVYPRGETVMFVGSVMFPEGTSGTTYSYAGAGEYYIQVSVGNVKSWEVVISPP